MVFQVELLGNDVMSWPWSFRVWNNSFRGWRDLFLSTYKIRVEVPKYFYDTCFKGPIPMYHKFSCSPTYKSRPRFSNSMDLFFHTLDVVSICLSWDIDCPFLLHSYYICPKLLQRWNSVSYWRGEKTLSNHFSFFCFLASLVMIVL